MGPRHRTCWSIQCEREYHLLITTACDDMGCVNQESFKSGTGLWLDESERSNDWITDSTRIENEHVQVKMGTGWDVEGFVG